MTLGSGVSSVVARFHIPHLSSQLLIQRLQTWWMHSSNNGIGELYKLVPSFICWIIWKTRCKAFYGQAFGNSVSASKQVRDLLFLSVAVSPIQCSPTQGQILLHHDFDHSVRAHSSVRILKVCWSFPTHLKLNVDASSLGNPRSSGGGGVIRDHYGRALAGFSTYYGCITSVQAEAKALLEGIHLCRELGLNGVEVEVDNQGLINMLHHTIAVPWRLMEFIHQILSLIEGRDFKFVHIYCEANQVADHLAKMGSIA